LAVFIFPERSWMMLIIEIHVDTIENSETNSSTSTRWQDEHPTRVNQKTKNIGNRFWKAININFPGSLKTKNKKER
jgi:hypothetical protein